MRSRARALLVAVSLGLVGALAPPGSARALPPPRAVGPPRLRICCALGRDLSLEVGGIHLPVAVDNVISPSSLGRHRYVARSVFDERNGLAYTCRGGIVDVAHVRATADVAAWLYVTIEAHVGTGARVELAGEDGRLALGLPELPPGRATSALDGDRAALARRVAAGAAWELAVWHELVTWAGRRTISVFSEGFSAFSPEDLYSDLLGAQLAERALASPRAWDDAVDEELARTLVALGARGAADTARALDQVEGRWWDRLVAVPNRELLLARSFRAGPTVLPWRAPDPRPLGCLDAAPLALDVAPIDGAYTLELLEVPEALARAPGRAGPVTRAELGELLTLAERQARRLGVATRPEEAGPERASTPRGGTPVARRSPRALSLRTLTASTAGTAERAGDGPGAGEVEALARAEAWAEALRAASEALADRRDRDGVPAADLDVEQGGAIRLLLLELAGGVTRGGALDRRGVVGGLELRGGHADTAGGQLTAARFTTAWRADRGALMTRFIGLEGRVFSCRDRATGELRAPVAAWFQDCEAGGSFGLEGSVAAVELDGGTGRMILRPIELALGLDALQTAFTPAYFRRRLLLFAGASLDAHSLEGGPGGVAPHLLGGARLLLGAPGLGVELEGYGSWRQGLLDTADHALETGVRIGRRFVLSRDRLAGAPSATLALGVEAGWSWWTRPETSMASFVHPVVSDVEPHTVHGLLTLALSFERLTF